MTLLFAIIAATAGPATMAGARPALVDATHDTVHCGGISGPARFSPPLTSTPNEDQTLTIKARLRCFPAGPAAISITNARVTGTITSHPTYTDCGIFTSYAASGTVTVRWTTTPEISTRTTSFDVNSYTIGFEGPTGHASKLAILIPGPVANSDVTGSFQGDDGGAMDSLAGISLKTIANTDVARCQAKGLHRILFRSPLDGFAATFG